MVLGTERENSASKNGRLLVWSDDGEGGPEASGICRVAKAEDKDDYLASFSCLVPMQEAAPLAEWLPEHMF